MTARSENRTADARRLLTELRATGVELTAEDGNLKFRAPRGLVTEQIRSDIARYRDELLGALALETASRTALQHLSQGKTPPLSFAQKRFWFLDQISSGSAQYNLGGVARLSAPVEPDAMRQAAHDIFSRHEAFRSRFWANHGEPRLEILDRSASTFEYDDLSQLTPSERASALADLRLKTLRTAFDLSKGKVAVIRLLRLSPHEHVLLIAMHHIIGDGVSIDRLWSEIAEFYAARLAGQKAHLAPLPLTYGDYAAWELAQATDGVFGHQLEYWREALAEAPMILDLPTDRARPAMASGAGARFTARIDEALVLKLRDLAHARGVTLFVLFTTVWQTLLSRLSGSDDVVIGTPVSTRSDSRLESVIGCFVNNVALRGDFSGAPSFIEQLERTKRTVLEVWRHADVPFEKVVEALKRPRSAAYAPIFQTLFTFLNYSRTDHPLMSSVQFETMSDTGGSRFDLSLELSADLAAHAGSMVAAYEYATDLFDESTVARVHRQFEQLLHWACAAPEDSLMRASLDTEDDRRSREGNHVGARRNLGHARLLPQSIGEVVQSSPNAIAVRCRDDVLTYAMFDERARRLADALRTLGAAPGKRVAFCLPRSVDLPVVMLAIVYTGAAYVPIDPAHPAERVALILQDAAPVCAVAADDTAWLVEGVSKIILGREMDGNVVTPPAPPAVGAEDLAYVIYTSGSTGSPKGVELTHGNLASFLAAVQTRLGFTPTETILSVTTPTFDISGLEIWLPLSTGGCVVIADEQEVIDGRLLAGLISQHDVRLLQGTPSTWRILLEAGWAGKPNLRALCGGEAMPSDLARQLLERTGEVWNMYGPTETTIWSTCRRVNDQDLAAPRIPIGEALSNTRVDVIEPDGARAGVGIVGELVISGAGVAAGYRNLPNLTAQKFVTMDIDGDSLRAFRTGDKVRWRKDGSLDFLGRNDDQVKVRGFRIQLEEVEAALSRHPAVQQGIVKVSTRATGAMLVGYVIPKAGEEPTTSELRRYMRSRLPDYMTPSVFMSIDAAPLSANGKIDRRALPSPFAAARRQAFENDALSPGLEQALAEVWKDVLETDHVGPFDNFFEIGGHSLLALRVAANVELRTGWRLDPRALFFQSLREVAAGAPEALIGTRG